MNKNQFSNIVHKYGAGTVADSLTPINQLGAFNWLQAADEVRVKAGGDAADTSDGAGAQKVKVYGLDENWNLAEEEITTAGASASAKTTTKFIRLFRAFVSAVGAYGAANTAAIEIETEAGTSLLKITAGEGQTQYGGYSVPANYQARLHSLYAVGDSTKALTLNMFTRDGGDVVEEPFNAKRLKLNLAAIKNHEVIFTPNYPMVFNEKTDLWFEGLVDSGTAIASVMFELELLPIT